jgi:DNA-binding phage protein
MRTQLLDKEDVVELLRAAVEQAGGQSEWASKQGVDRSLLNRVLRGQRAPTKEIIRALKLCNTVGFDDDPRRTIRRGQTAAYRPPAE